LNPQTFNRRVNPVAAELYEILAMQQATRDAKWPKCPQAFYRDGERILALVAGANEPNRVFHGVRRRPERVAMISGHKTRAAFGRYNIVSERDVRDAAEKSWINRGRSAGAQINERFITRPKSRCWRSSVGRASDL
jgi:hypothetical protein